jgi:hypothetical protein
MSEVSGSSIPSPTTAEIFERRVQSVSKLEAELYKMVTDGDIGVNDAIELPPLEFESEVEEAIEDFMQQVGLYDYTQSGTDTGYVADRLNLYKAISSIVSTELDGKFVQPPRPDASYYFVETHATAERIPTANPDEQDNWLQISKRFRTIGGRIVEETVEVSATETPLLPVTQRWDQIKTRLEERRALGLDGPVDEDFAELLVDGLGRAEQRLREFTGKDPQEARKVLLEYGQQLD